MTDDLHQLTGITDAEAAAIEQAAIVDRHALAARFQAGVLVGKVQALARNGVDLRDAHRLTALIAEDVAAGVAAAAVPECACNGSHSVSAMELLVQLAVLAADPDQLRY